MKLISPQVIVQLEQPGSDDLIEYTVQTDNRDVVQFDVLRARKSWPAAKDAPALWLTVLAWHALKRTGAITDDADAFIGRCVQVQPVNEDPNDDAVPPTPPAVGAGS